MFSKLGTALFLGFVLGVATYHFGTDRSTRGEEIEVSSITADPMLRDALLEDDITVVPGSSLSLKCDTTEIAVACSLSNDEFKFTHKPVSVSIGRELLAPELRQREDVQMLRAVAERMVQGLKESLQLQ